MTSVIFFVKIFRMQYQRYLDNEIESFIGKTILITGANSGIGFGLALEAAYKGARVILACRNKKRAETAMAKIKKEVPDSRLKFIRYDQADLDSIDNFIHEISNINIDVIVLNAGIFKPSKNSVTKQGYSLTVGTNYLGVYYLMNRLEEYIEAKRIKHIIFVTSFVRRFAPRNYLSYLINDKNRLVRAYFSSKRMIYELAMFYKRKYRNLKISLMHPGNAVTGIVNNELDSMPNWLHKVGNVFLRLFANTEEKSALAFMMCIDNANKKDLGFYYPRGLFHIKGYPTFKNIEINRSKCERLFDETHKALN